MKNSHKLLTVFAVAAFGLSSAASATVIDLFSSPVDASNHAVAVGANTPLSQTQQYFDNNGSIIGDYRDLQVTDVSGTTSGLAGKRTMLSAGGDRLTFSNDTGVQATAVITWDGSALNNGTTWLPQGIPQSLLDDPVTGLSANLINQEGCPVSGCSYFQTLVYFADQGYDIQLGVYTNATTYSLLDFTTAAVDDPAGVPSIFLFSWFDTAGLQQEVEPGFKVDVTHGGGGKADFTNVGALQLVLNTGKIAGVTTAVDLDIGAVQKFGVPEPGSLALFGLGLMGLGALSRRGKKA